MPDDSPPPLTLTSPYDSERPDTDKCRVQCNINEADYSLIKTMRLKWGNLEPTLGTLTHALAEACRHFQIKDYQQHEDYVRLIKSITFIYNGRVYSPYTGISLPTGGTPLVVNTQTPNGNDGGRTGREHPTLEVDAPVVSDAPQRVGKGRGRTDRGGKETTKG